MVYTCRVTFDQEIVHCIISPLVKQIKPKRVKKEMPGRKKTGKKWFMQIGIINM